MELLGMSADIKLMLFATYQLKPYAKTIKGGIKYLLY
jgi:hypothetical protein